MNTWNWAGIAALLVTVIGCGASKQYVSDSIAASEARTGERMAAAEGETAQLAAEVERLNQLAIELEKKQAVVINNVAGFENYQILWSGEMTFAFNSYDLTDQSRSSLDEAGIVLKQAAGSLVELVGHTDATGPQSYNQLLGQHRADAAKRYLADRHDVKLYRMFTMSEGEDKPVAAGDSRSGSGQNRRVVVRVWGLPQQAAAGQ